MSFRRKRLKPTRLRKTSHLTRPSPDSVSSQFKWVLIGVFVIDPKTIPEIDTANMFRDDGTVLSIKKPTGKYLKESQKAGKDLLL